MGTGSLYNCPDCEREMVRIFDYNLCNHCDVVRDQEKNSVLKTFLWKPECIRVKYDFLYTVLLAKNGKATLDDVIKQVERKPLEYGCDERVKMPLTMIFPPELTKEELEQQKKLQEKLKDFSQEDLRKLEGKLMDYSPEEKLKLQEKLKDSSPERLLEILQDIQDS